MPPKRSDTVWRCGLVEVGMTFLEEVLKLSDRALNELA